MVDDADFLIWQANFGAMCSHTATLEVRNLVSFFDSGRFNLLIDGTAYAEGVGFGGSTGEVEVDAGEHSVSEAAASGISLSNYNTTILCRDEDGRGGIVAFGSGTSLMVDVGAGDDVVCTIVNTRARGSGRWR